MLSWFLLQRSWCSVDKGAVAELERGDCSIKIPSFDEERIDLGGLIVNICEYKSAERLEQRST